MRTFNNRKLSSHYSRRLVERRSLKCVWSNCQGFLENLQRQRQTTTDGPNVAPEFQPLLFDRRTGIEIPFCTDSNAVFLSAVSRRAAYEYKISPHVAWRDETDADKDDNIIMSHYSTSMNVLLEGIKRLGNG